MYNGQEIKNMEIREKEDYDGGSPYVNDTELTTLTGPKLNIPEDTKEQKVRKQLFSTKKRCDTSFIKQSV